MDHVQIKYTIETFIDYTASTVLLSSHPTVQIHHRPLSSVTFIFLHIYASSTQISTDKKQVN